MYLKRARNANFSRRIRSVPSTVMRRPQNHGRDFYSYPNRLSPQLQQELELPHLECMQLRSGSKFIINSDLLKEIENYPHEICYPDKVKELSLTNKIVAVGDYTSMILENSGIDLSLCVVDLKTRRSKDGRFRHIPGSITVTNEKSTLSHDLFMEIERSLLRGKTRIEVRGEEDLAVIPIIYYYDYNTVVCYGVPHKGMACIKITPEIKERIKSMMERMSVSNG